jgi:predicted phage terminase large subunit-like protein
MTSMFASLRQALESDPSASLRAEQRPPDGDWTVWLFCGGRGVGKNHSGSCWVNAIASRACRIALVSPTSADARDVMVLGPSGIVALAANWNRPVFEPSRRRLVWPSGAEAMLFSAEEPDRLRGPQFHYAWVDELAAMRDARNVWNMLMMGLRLGEHPRCFVSTTPRPIPLLRELIARNGADVIVTRGRTMDNAANLAPTFLTTILKQYEGTRLGRQELEAELLEDVQGALWTRDMLDKARVAPDALPAMRRVVVAVDPSGARGADDERADSIGIVVAALGVDGRGYVIEDCTTKDSPAGWGRKAVSAYRRHRADRIVAERNFGGAMVQHVLRTADPSIPFKEVVASRGKIVRAEPIAALFEQGRVSIVNGLSELEDQLCAMTSEGYVGGGSPDRADAMVWALSELMVTQASPMIVQPFWSIFGNSNKRRYGR